MNWQGNEMAEESRFKRFYRWWLIALSELLARRRAPAQSWTVLLQNTPHGIEIYARSGQSGRLIASVPLDATGEQDAIVRSMLDQERRADLKHVLLRMSPSHVLHQTIQIPDAASDVIAPILDNQMERMVPWPDSETRYGYRVVGPNADVPGHVDVDVVATRKDIVDSLIERAQRLGLHPFAVDYAPSMEATTSISLQSLRTDPVHRIAAGLHTALLTCAALALLTALAGGYLMWDRYAVVRGLEAEVAAARERVAAISKLAAENDHLREQRDKLVRRKEDEPPVMLLIEALSRALPDTSHATEVDIQGRDVRIVGLSANASALITDLEDSPHFEDVRFAAPTTRETPDAKESFVIIGRAEGGSLLEARP